MAQTDPVSNAIQAALNDINLLRVLVHAPTKEAANTVLHKYKESLTLQGPDVERFYNRLQTSTKVITASELVRYYDCLQPPKEVREPRGTEGEWVP